MSQEEAVSVNHMKHYLLTYTKKRQYILFLGDMLVIALSIFISYVIRIYVNQKHPSMSIVLSRFSPWLLLVMLFHWLSLYVCNQYNLNRQINLIRSSVNDYSWENTASLMIKEYQEIAENSNN